MLQVGLDIRIVEKGGRLWRTLARAERLELLAYAQLFELHQSGEEAEGACTARPGREQ